MKSPAAFFNRRRLGHGLATRQRRLAFVRVEAGLAEPLALQNIRRNSRRPERNDGMFFRRLATKLIMTE